MCHASFGQSSKLLPWSPPPQDEDSRARVYHPEPILFVHGINANDKGWITVADSLTPRLSTYDIPDTAYALVHDFRNLENYWTEQQNYLHTFNYGDKRWTSPQIRNVQSMDHIEYNVLEDDQTRTFPPTWCNTIDLHPLAGQNCG
jgi:hypothetical protein